MLKCNLDHQLKSTFPENLKARNVPFFFFQSQEHETPNETSLKSVYSLVKRWALAEEEERVDEIECKVFIKRGDSNLLSICRELQLRDGLCSEATTRSRGLWNLLWSSASRGLAAVLDKLSPDYRGEEREREQSVVTLTLQQEAANQSPIRISALRISKITYSNSQVQAAEIHFIIISSAVALLGRQKKLV